jgi:hypothetical protein
MDSGRHPKVACSLPTALQELPFAPRIAAEAVTICPIEMIR